MTNPTLERAARAAGEVYFGPDVVIDYPTSSVWTDVVRAVLMAVRTCPIETEAAGLRALPVGFVGSNGDVPAMWTAMIDAILAEGE